MAYHLNSNLLIAIDLETTGLDPDVHEIWQIGIIPLTASFEPIGIPFELDIRPTKPELADRAVTGLSIPQFDLLMKCPMTHENAEDLFWDWVQSQKDRGLLQSDRKLIPLAQNWVFDRDFLIRWLSRESFESIFHPWYRDPMMGAQMENDWNYHFGDPRKTPYEKANLTALCHKLKVKNLKPHRALPDARATAEVYKRLVFDRKAA